MFKRDLKKCRETRDQTANIYWIINKARELQKNIYFFTDYGKTFDCADHNKLQKILQEMRISDHLTCLLKNLYSGSGQSSSVQSLSRVQLFATPWITARQASLSITNSQSSLKLMSIESVMPSSHLILCYPLLCLPPIPPSIKVFSNESTPHEVAKVLEFQL